MFDSDLTRIENNDIMNNKMEVIDMRKKFKVGDIVRVKKDLIIGKTYYSEDGMGDKFTYLMDRNSGKEGRIIEIDYVGYKLDIDPIHTYTDGMLEKPVDELAVSDYDFNLDVEAVIINSKFIAYKRQIDKALDGRMFEKEPQKFRELIDEYTKFFEKNESIIIKMNNNKY